MSMSSMSAIDSIAKKIAARISSEGNLSTTDLLLAGIYSELLEAREERETARLQAENQKTPLAEEQPITPPARPRRPRKSLGE